MNLCVTPLLGATPIHTLCLGREIETRLHTGNHRLLFRGNKVEQIFLKDDFKCKITSNWSTHTVVFCTYIYLHLETGKIKLNLKNSEKLEFLYTSKAYHRILGRIVC